VLASSSMTALSSAAASGSNQMARRLGLGIGGHGWASLGIFLLDPFCAARHDGFDAVMDEAIEQQGDRDGDGGFTCNLMR
jgi:hypothetical protein